MRILVTETRVYVVEVDSGPESYAVRRAKEFNCSTLSMCKKLAQVRVAALPPQTYNEPADYAGVQLLHGLGINNNARGMAPGEEV